MNRVGWVAVMGIVALGGLHEAAPRVCPLPVREARFVSQPALDPSCRETAPSSTADEAGDASAASMSGRCTAP
jgi:hypothetical protein